MIPTLRRLCHRVFALVIINMAAAQLTQNSLLSGEQAAAKKLEWKNMKASSEVIDYSFFDYCRYVFLDVGSNVSSNIKNCNSFSLIFSAPIALLFGQCNAHDLLPWHDDLNYS